MNTQHTLQWITMFIMINAIIITHVIMYNYVDSQPTEQHYKTIEKHYIETIHHTNLTIVNKYLIPDNLTKCIQVETSKLDFIAYYCEK